MAWRVVLVLGLFLISSLAVASLNCATEASIFKSHTSKKLGDFLAALDIFNNSKRKLERGIADMKKELTECDASGGGGGGGAADLCWSLRGRLGPWLYAQAGKASACADLAQSEQLFRAAAPALRQCSSAAGLCKAAHCVELQLLDDWATCLDGSGWSLYDDSGLSLDEARFCCHTDGPFWCDWAVLITIIALGSSAGVSCLGFIVALVATVKLGEALDEVEWAADGVEELQKEMEGSEPDLGRKIICSWAARTSLVHRMEMERCYEEAFLELSRWPAIRLEDLEAFNFHLWPHTLEAPLAARHKPFFDLRLFLNYRQIMEAGLGNLYCANSSEPGYETIMRDLPTFPRDIGGSVSAGEQPSVISRSRSSDETPVSTEMRGTASTQPPNHPSSGRLLEAVHGQTSASGLSADLKTQNSRSIKKNLPRQ